MESEEEIIHVLFMAKEEQKIVVQAKNMRGKILFEKSIKTDAHLRINQILNAINTI